MRNDKDNVIDFLSFLRKTSRSKKTDNANENEVSFKPAGISLPEKILISLCFMSLFGIVLFAIVAIFLP